MNFALDIGKLDAYFKKLYPLRASRTSTLWGDDFQAIKPAWRSEVRCGSIVLWRRDLALHSIMPWRDREAGILGKRVVLYDMDAKPSKAGAVRSEI